MTFTTVSIIELGYFFLIFHVEGKIRLELKAQTLIFK
jgi:hypothetical protein